MERDGEIILTADDGSEEAFFVMEKAVIAGHEYLLVTDQDPAEDQTDDDMDQEANALILRVNEQQDEDENGDDRILYDVVEDEKELQILSKYFEELLDGIGFEM